MRYNIIAISACGLSLNMVQPALASDAALATLENARQECQSFDDGVFTSDPKYTVNLLDVTGDGIADEIIDGNYFSCSTVATLYCGTGGCGLTVIADGNPFEFLAKAWSVEANADGKPTLKLAVHWSQCDYTRDCWESFVWDGDSFESLGSEADTAADEDPHPVTEWALQGSGDAPITLSFEDSGKISGRASCNQYFADIRVSIPRISVGNIGSTRMICPEQATEDQYFQNLRDIVRFEVSDDLLKLHTDGGETLTFDRN